MCCCVVDLFLYLLLLLYISSIIISTNIYLKNLCNLDGNPMVARELELVVLLLRTPDQMQLVVGRDHQC